MVLVTFLKIMIYLRQVDSSFIVSASTNITILIFEAYQEIYLWLFICVDREITFSYLEFPVLVAKPPFEI